MVTAAMVKELRDMTGAGMLDCQKALKEVDGNMDKAVEFLREKGLAIAAKKAGRIASEGMVYAYLADDKKVGTLVEVNSETDFVAKNDEFKSFVANVAKIVAEQNPADVEALKALAYEDKTVGEALTALIAKIGEKISFRRFELVEKTDAETFGAYTHMNSKIAVLIVVEGANEEVAKDVAMHAAAMRPKYFNIDSVPAEDVEHEREIQKQIAMNEGKPADIAEKMVEGRIKKFYKEVCLTEQPFVKNDDMSVAEFVKSNGGVVKSMVRYEVGEGMQKKEENFADEVAKQMA
jgi:elongation factor Ts